MDLVALAKSIGINGFQHPSELDALAQLAAGRTVLEVGSFEGLTAWAMAPVAVRVLCLDSFEAATDGQRQTGALTTLDAFRAATNRFKNVEFIVSTSDRAAQNGLPYAEFGMVFIDAMHTRSDVLADIDRWWPYISHGGLLVGHDYAHPAFPGVKEAFDERFGSAPEGTTVGTLRWVTKP